MNKGSILILTIIAVLILSVMVSGLLTVGTTEIQTTQNYQLSKVAFYTAMQGVEEIRNQIYNAPDAASVLQVIKSASQTRQEDHGLVSEYITGTMTDLEAGGAGVNIAQFKGFEAPALVGITLGGATSISSIVWKVNVTSNVSAGSKNAYAEIITGVYSIAVVGY